VSAQKPLVKMGWLAVVAGALILLGADTVQKVHVFRAITAIGEQGRHAPAFDLDSPTGYAGGRRSQILQSTDGYHWVMQTQQMIARGNWRVRHVDYDNAPDGREVHWCSPLHAWLALVAWFDHLVTGRSWIVSLEHAALYAGPLLLAVFLTGLVPWAARHFGVGAAAVLAAGFVLVAPLSGEFGAGSYDHHGVAAACALLSVLCLVAGWNFPTEARRHFIAAGFAGAVGLWVNAATQIPVLAGLGLGALVAHRLARRTPATAPDPNLWRLWGLAGGAASLVFYLLEYFPAHLGWRLEVNHPLYALAWAGAGDWLARLTGRGLGRSWWTSAADRALGFAAALAIVLPPALMLLMSAQTFVVADKFLWTLHVDYISEFAPLFSQPFEWERLLVGINVLPLFSIAALWVLWRGGLAPAQRALVALGLPAALLVTLLAWSQQRWVHVECALWLAVLAAAIVAARASQFAWSFPRRVMAGLYLAAVFLPYPVRAGLDAWRGATGLSRENIRQFALRDLAFWLRRQTGADPVVVLSGPTATTELIYHGGFHGIGTLYWENIAGLRATVDILGASDPAQALALLQARGVTHLVLLPWGPFAKESARLARGLRATDPVPTGTFAAGLLKSAGDLPDWVKPLPYHLPEAEQFKDQVAVVLEIVPTQSPVDAAVGRAQFLAALGNPAGGEALVREVLAVQPDHMMALVTLAGLQRANRDRVAHAATIQRVRPLLSTEPKLTLNERVALAWELAAAGARDESRAEIVRSWGEADERALKRLTPEAVPQLLRLTRDYAVEVNRDRLQLVESIQAADRRGGTR
jgi:hypothetical protein